MGRLKQSKLISAVLTIAFAAITIIQYPTYAISPQSRIKPIDGSGPSRLENKNIVLYSPAHFAITGVRTYMDALLPNLAVENPNLSMHVIVMVGDHNENPAENQSFPNGSEIIFHTLDAKEYDEKDPEKGSRLIQEKLLEIKERGGIDLIVSHAPFHDTGRQFNKFGEKWGIPVIQMYHGGPWGLLGKTEKTEPNEIIPHTIEILKGATAIVTVSKYVAERFKQDYGKQGIEDVSVLYPVVDLSHWDPDKVYAKDVQQLKQDKGLDNNFIVFVGGRIIPSKGFSTIVQAMKKMCVRHEKPITLMIAGPISDRYQGHIQELIKQAGEDVRLIFLGSLTPMEMRNWYAASDVVVVPSLKPDNCYIGEETFGLVSIEAQKMGKPVIVSRSGGLIETLIENETGFVFSPGDYDELRKYLQKLYDDPNLRVEMGNKAREYVEKRFKKEELVKQHAKSYLRAMQVNQTLVESP